MISIFIRLPRYNCRISKAVAPPSPLLPSQLALLKSRHDGSMALLQLAAMTNVPRHVIHLVLRQTHTHKPTAGGFLFLIISLSLRFPPFEPLAPPDSLNVTPSGPLGLFDANTP